jgi:cytidylate kinase
MIRNTDFCLMTSTPFIIAIDGHSSCGKSTIARALASKLGFTYLDTGAMYRGVALYFIEHQVNIHNHSEVKQALDKITIEFGASHDGISPLLLNGKNVEKSIRNMLVSSKVSEVAALKPVRDKLVDLQRKMSQKTSVVLDGRDIGTVVFPKAQLKLFVTASEEIRAQRRYDELIIKGDDITLDEVLENLKHRDHLDSTRKESPLKEAHDAVVLDNSKMTREEQMDFVVALVEGK